MEAATPAHQSVHLSMDRERGGLWDMNGPRTIKYKKVEYTLAPNTMVRVDYRNVFRAGQEKNWVVGVIVDVLAMQFTALIVDPNFGEQLVYRHYADVGTTWEPVPDVEAK